ncbi:Metacaspase-1 [Leucoagaricus sp. SymC.cos]|nr:Metacaspase-1 [Leucoagaricus sp. SymC.cos]
MSFFKEVKDTYKHAQQQGYRSTDAPAFPQAPGALGGYPPPSGPPPSGPPASSGYNPSYAPSYGPPAGGYPPPSGPPSQQGFGFPTPSPGFNTPSYPPPSGPPPSSRYPQSSPQPPSSGGYPGQQYNLQRSSHQGGYLGQQHHQQQHHQQHYPPPSNPPPGGYQPGGNQWHPQGPPPRPPNTVQNYGPQFQGPNHQPAQPFFQYSQCTGKKKALCIGINYVGQNGELRGCINDARNIQRFLCSRFGYKTEDIVMLTDDAQNPRMKPTKDNIIQAMQWLVKGAAPNDSLFFHYSGHGGQTKDVDGDEADGYDEVIYPLDFQQKGHIVDDLMHEIMVKPLPTGCRLTAIFDSCHSGSALDLPYIYSTEGKVKEPNLAAEAGQGLLSAVSSYAKGDMGGVFKSALGLVKTAAGNSSKADKYAKATRTSSADVISWSGCKDSQTSADTQEAGQATGAMSYAFISALSSNTQQSYQELLNNIRDILRSKYDQKPQLSSSHPMDTNIMFIC